MFHSTIRRWLLVTVLAGVVLAGACGGPASAPPAQPSPTPVVAAPDATPVVAAPVITPPGAKPAPEGINVNLEELFPPPAEMRNLVLNTCTNCHTFVPIVVLQMDSSHWGTSMNTHREYVTAISEEERQALYDYLKANFNPDRPVPELPPELLETWTSY